jgi:hypothetical protein
MFKLPFGSLPAHWGLAGKTRQIAQAEYELEGYELAKRLLEIKEDEYDRDTFLKKVWETDLKFGKITEAEYYRNLTSLIKDPKQQQLAMLELDYREHKVTDLEYQKQSATLKGEPWVTVLDMDFNSKNSLEGSFELDWNEHFVEKLKAEGYTGPTPDNIVNQWFMEVCRNVAMEEFDGTGDFTADSQANLETMKRWSNDSKPNADGRKGYR